ncbi:MAG: sugar phosphate isomerase/epimerase, partial [Pirellulaceae bacterium]
MLQLKIGVQLQSLRLPLRKALFAAQQLGAAAVEVDARKEVRPQEFTGTALRQFRKLLDDLNLRVCAVSFRTRHGYNVAEGL